MEKFMIIKRGKGNNQFSVKLDLLVGLLTIGSSKNGNL